MEDLLKEKAQREWERDKRIMMSVIKIYYIYIWNCWITIPLSVLIDSQPVQQRPAQLYTSSQLFLVKLIKIGIKIQKT